MSVGTRTGKQCHQEDHSQQADQAEKDPHHRARIVSTCNRHQLGHDRHHKSNTFYWHCHNDWRVLKRSLTLYP